MDFFFAVSVVNGLLNQILLIFYNRGGFVLLFESHFIKMSFCVVMRREVKFTFC